MVGQRIDASLGQHFGHLFNAFARLTIDHARLTFVLALNEAQQLRRGVFFFNNGVANVGAVKTADEQPSVFKLKTLNDVCSRQRIGRGRERNPRHPRKSLVQDGEASVFRPKIMTPLTHAMGFIDGKQT